MWTESFWKITDAIAPVGEKKKKKSTRSSRIRPMGSTICRHLAGGEVKEWVEWD